jgi:uncharacterized protein YprB with RNaseH-like and TPR domain
MQHPNDKAKVLLFDIECTHLKADFGTILCIGYKWLGKKKVYIPAITDYKGWKKHPWDDKKLVSDFKKILEEADMWVTYYGKGFDVPYLQAKCLEHDLGILPNCPHVDLYFTVKSNLALSRKSLDNVSKYLNLENKKTPVTGGAWKRAMCGDKKSIKYVIDHCDADVLILEEAYLKMRGLVRTHPRVGGLGVCRTCGEDRLQSRGYRINNLQQRRRRIQCQICNSWDTRPL